MQEQGTEHGAGAGKESAREVCAVFGTLDLIMHASVCHVLLTAR